MNTINLKAVQTPSSAAGHWNTLLVIAILFTGCVAKNGLHLNLPDGAAAGSNDTGGTGAVGGSMTGGSNGQGGNGAVSSAAGGSNGTRTGGVSGSAGGSIALTSNTGGGIWISTGGVTSQGGATSSGRDGGGDDGEADASSDALCDTTSLWGAIGYKLRQTNPFVGDCFPGKNYSNMLVFDNEGHLVDDTWYSGSDKQAWLDWLAATNQSWPCLAGQTIRYTCSIGG
jgi:hypothetical protein